MGRVNKAKLQQSPNNLARTGSARTCLILQQPYEDPMTCYINLDFRGFKEAVYPLKYRGHSI